MLQFSLFTLSVLLFCLRSSLSQDDLAEPSYDLLAGNVPVRLIHDYRCKDGRSSTTGRVEVNVDGVWGTICRNRLTKITGDFLCRQMGYSYSRYTNSLYCSKASDEVPMLLSYINCNGDEDSIMDCKNDTEPFNFCFDYYRNPHVRDLALTCYKKRIDRPRELPLSLDFPDFEILGVPLQSECSGIVSISYDGYFGYVSKVGVDDLVGTVICEQLGHYKYLGPLPSEYITDIFEPILLAKPYCIGKENELRECPNYGWGPFPHLDQYGVLSVQCACQPKFECGELEEKGIRLRSKVNPWEGRLEVKVDGEWGSVCSHGFSLISAKVACRQLGYRPGTYFTKDIRNGGYGPIKLRNVDCLGHEQSLTECSHFAITDSVDIYCKSHYLDVMLRCEAEPPEPRVRLVEPVAVYNRFRGECKLLEVWYGSDWYPHCCEGGSEIQYNLATVCREASGQYLSNSGCTVPISDSIQSVQGSYSCRDDTCYTDGCGFEDFAITDNCTSKQYTYVCCSSTLPDLVPNFDVLLRSLGGLRSRSTRRFYTHGKRCAVEDGCLAIDADPDNIYDVRKVISFSTQSDNLGTDDFRPPVDNNQWIYHQCHGHFHSMEHFVDYSLRSSDGLYAVAEGHKASFCLEDSGCNWGAYSRYRCGSGRSGYQGISPGCYDLYAQHLDCQWVDVTRVSHGDYRLELNMNPSKLVPESDFSNNKIVCLLEFNVDHYQVKSCMYEYVSTPGHS